MMQTKNKWGIFAFVGILLIALHLVLVTTHQTYVGISLEQTPSNNWIVSDVAGGSWGQINGIRLNDQVIEIDGEVPFNSLYATKYGVLEKVHTFVIQRGTQLLYFSIQDEHQANLVLTHTILPAGTFLMCFFFALFLYWKKPGDRAARVLILFFLAVGLGYLSAGASSRMDLFGKALIALCLLHVPVLFLHFIHHYLRQITVKYRYAYIIKLFYLINAIFLSVLVWFLFGPLDSMIVDSVITTIMLVLFAIYMLVTTYALVQGYLQSKKTVYKPVFKIMLFSNVIVFFPFVWLSVFPMVVLGAEIVPSQLSAAFLLFLPPVYIYLVTANRFMDIDFYISRLKYYAALGFLPSMLITLLLAYVLHHTNVHLLIWVPTFLLVYGGMIAFLYVKEWLDFRFRSKLFIERNDFQDSLDQFVQQIAQVKKTCELEERLLKEVYKSLPITSCSLLVYDIETNTVTQKQSVLQSELPESLQDMRLDAPKYDVGEFVGVAEGTCIVIHQNQGKYLLLWMSEKLNHTTLNLDEIGWLKNLSVYVSIVYVNLQLIEGFIKHLEANISKNQTPSWVLRLLFNLSENERRRLASDLHDSALQDQLLWYRKVELLSAHPELSPTLRSEIDEIQEGLLDVIHQIRETCNELRPPLLSEMGLVEALDSLFGYAQLRADYVVLFDHQTFDAVLDDEQILVLYRIVQELLNNAMKHSKASEVSIALRSDEENIYFSYCDNGVGMDLKGMQYGFEHMGLTGIRERVAGLDGETHFTSQTDNGLQVEILLPLKVATFL